LDITKTDNKMAIGKKGKERYYDVRVTPLRNRQEQLTGLLIVLRDITSRKEMRNQMENSTQQLNLQNEELRKQSEILSAQQKELMEKSKELEIVNQTKSEFLANMSHEIRTPLNAVIGFAELMLDGLTGEINEEQRQNLNDIYSSGQHLLNLVNDVLDLSKVEAGKMEIVIEHLNVPNIIDNTVKMVKPIIDENKLSLEIDIEEGLPQIDADRNRFRQILYNLLSNAAKFTKANGNIQIKAVKAGDYCQVSVIDSGIGIKKEDFSRIFDSFTQGDTLPGREIKGTGLGLRLSRQLVELMGGKLWFGSTWKRGSEFHFTLPFVQTTSSQ